MHVSEGLRRTAVLLTATCGIAGCGWFGEQTTFPLTGGRQGTSLTSLPSLSQPPVFDLRPGVDTTLSERAHDGSPVTFTDAPSVNIADRDAALRRREQALLAERALVDRVLGAPQGLQPGVIIEED